MFTQQTKTKNIDKDVIQGKGGRFQGTELFVELWKGLEKVGTEAEKGKQARPCHETFAKFADLAFFLER